ncbi:MAG: helix-turn-helix domain-containing protein [Spirochaetales bacterium]|nr:helix-turn-helix domain-containing protein [Spirochaetales bacterium]
MPLIIVNIRFLVLCGFIAPAFVLSTSTINLFSKRRQYYVIGTGILVGIIYVLFTILSTPGSYPVFKLGDITAHDTYTPSFVAPFYGREVTIAIQVLLGLVLSLFTVMNILRLWKNYKKEKMVHRKYILINTGALIFALSFMIGSYLKQWWAFYTVSIFSAIIIGGGVLIDIKEMQNKIEKIIPLLKDDLIQNVSISLDSSGRIADMLKIIGKNESFDTFLVVKINLDHEEQRMIDHDLDILNNAITAINRKMHALMADKDFLVLPLGSDKTGICLAVRNYVEADKSFLMNLAETLHKEIRRKLKTQVFIGMGRSYSRFENLPLSFKEALIAQEYAQRVRHTNVISIESIQAFTEKDEKYPFELKKELLQALRVGNMPKSKKYLDEFMQSFIVSFSGKLDELKVKVYELIISISKAAMEGGADNKKIYECNTKFFNSADAITNIMMAKDLLTEFVDNVVCSVNTAQQKNAASSIEKAIAFIEKNYRKNLSLKEIASHVFLSTSHLQHLFKSETGQSITRYLNRVRMEKATGLLKEARLNISEIAFELGFNDACYFSKAFKKFYGVAPTEFKHT